MFTDEQAFNSLGMTAATSEYAMLDSMFAMDPVFPGLGGLEGLDQPMQVDQQFINSGWGGPDTNTQSQTRTQTRSGNDDSTLSNDPNSFARLPYSTQPHQTQFQDQNQTLQPPNLSSSMNAILTTPPDFTLPNSPWAAWLNNQTSGGVDGNSTMQSDVGGGLLATGGGGTGAKKTMSSSEVYKTVTKP